MKLSRILFTGLLLAALFSESFGMTHRRAISILEYLKSTGEFRYYPLRRAVSALAGVHDCAGRDTLTEENLRLYFDSYNIGDDTEEVAKRFAAKLKADLDSFYAAKGK